MLQRTLTFIKPDTMNEGHVGEIVSMIEAAGFRLVAAKIQCLTKDDAARFYEVHRGKDFFEGLIEYASSGSILAICIEKDDAIEDLRSLVGVTDPKEAAEGTIRALFGHTVRKNAIHASDGTATAEKEIRFFFPEIEARLF